MRNRVRGREKGEGESEGGRETERRRERRGETVWPGGREGPGWRLRGTASGVRKVQRSAWRAPSCLYFSGNHRRRQGCGGDGVHRGLGSPGVWRKERGQLRSSRRPWGADPAGSWARGRHPPEDLPCRAVRLGVTLPGVPMGLISGCRVPGTQTWLGCGPEGLWWPQRAGWVLWEQRLHPPLGKGKAAPTPEQGD